MSLCRGYDQVRIHFTRKVWRYILQWWPHFLRHFRWNFGTILWIPCGKSSLSVSCSSFIVLVNWGNVFKYIIRLDSNATFQCTITGWIETAQSGRPGEKPSSCQRRRKASQGCLFQIVIAGSDPPSFCWGVFSAHQCWPLSSSLSRWQVSNLVDSKAKPNVRLNH